MAEITRVKGERTNGIKIVKCVSGNYHVYAMERDVWLRWREGQLSTTTKTRGLMGVVTPNSPAYSDIHAIYEKRMGR